MNFLFPHTSIHEEPSVLDSCYSVSVLNVATAQNTDKSQTRHDINSYFNKFCYTDCQGLLNVYVKFSMRQNT